MKQRPYPPRDFRTVVRHALARARALIADAQAVVEKSQRIVRKVRDQRQRRRSRHAP